MARNQHTYAKRQRELAKKQKADEKRERRRNKGKTSEAETPVEQNAVAQGTGNGVETPE